MELTSMASKFDYESRLDVDIHWVNNCGLQVGAGYILSPILVVDEILTSALSAGEVQIPVAWPALAKRQTLVLPSRGTKQDLHSS